MSKEEGKVEIVCPTCDKERNIKIPVKVLRKGIMTVSIPRGLVCKHHFHVFIDSHLKVRGYQDVDYEFPKLEIYESDLFKSDQMEKKDFGEFSSEISSEIISILRNCVDDIEILGSALFSVEGKVIYSSISHQTLLDTIREFEIRNNQKLVEIIKLFIELKNHQKLCSEYIEIDNHQLIVILVFSDLVNFGMGIMFLKKIVQKIKNYSKIREEE